MDVMSVQEKISRGEFFGTKNVNVALGKIGPLSKEGQADSKNLSQISTNPNSANLLKQQLEDRGWAKQPTLGDLKRRQDTKQGQKTTEHEPAKPQEDRLKKKIAVDVLLT